MHVAFLTYTDKVKIVSNAAVRLKDNPYQGNLIGVGADFAKETQERWKVLIPFKKYLQKSSGEIAKFSSLIPLFWSIWIRMEAQKLYEMKISKS